MPESQLLIIIAVIVVASLIALKVYTYRKARYLRELGYSFVYYYMKSCGDINYYRNSDNHIGKKYKSSFDILEENRSKWFLGVSSRIKINHLIIFILFRKTWNKFILIGRKKEIEVSTKC